ncbi:MAG: hypothetical protein UV64_C0024G0005 [Parcubacteria group bacterium GW2011_GWC1_43_11b]|uniref:DNA polymerase III delta N-terminal domain-containing protein n=2 Tax=Candidatus Vogeliibacteriota TaxID=1817922 RepID=A0A1G2QCL4_9BACT|nr:MAG: hypothetical protein UV50_C0020G0003 [Parcubacteria group bacterium GW2011_GWB1_42_9]KKS88353.1 MAG: hypothetical protein UV64_C0024G0005 [Parcubacteria group bacterium GW2011_GWC1_43_11b]KKT08914.1 MAG: hypothetical protein UV88_C0018G0006 [Parcubacteria group bacterium GW2011_GWA1_43_21]OHA58310.1 MAG: hypothetical protein A2370_01590 [Candidatus Vogelbacteria bacterium RIFOXYB1_FULL_42_16]OHA59081.1 MAG: hypothetical protein A2607_01075 [Candidatus Vogelbacteria bacterium RIFOXYD1_FU
MLYLIYGPDTVKAQNKYNDLIASLRTKQPNSAVFLLNRENFNAGQWAELLVGQSLFYEKYIVGLNRLLNEKEFGELVIKNLAVISQSPHIFILIEETIDLKIFEQIEKSADKVLFFKKEETEAEEKGNEFAVAEALARRDKKKLWLEYNRSLAEGKEADMVFWQIWWQLRMLLIAKTTKQKAPKSIKPFVFSKAVRGAGNYSEDELKSLAGKLVNFYHKHFIGSENFVFGLEKIILEI